MPVPAERVPPARGLREGPFRKAKSLDKRLKLLLWGDAGTGKTTLALQFPKPVLIDLEGSADLYGDLFDFDVMRASTADEVMAAVEWLQASPHSYRTLVVDPITVYWDALQRKWSDIFLRRNRGTKGYRFEFYDLQPRDWMTVKGEWKDFIRKLIALDLTVVVTARQKIQYADGAYMRAVGETFDGERTLPYMFDSIVRLYRDEKGRFMGECLKDRSRKLPLGDFESSYAVFEQAFGRDVLERAPRPISRATAEQLATIRRRIDELGLSPDRVASRLAAYQADCLEDLTEENAALIIEKLMGAAGSGRKTDLSKEV